MQCFVYFKRVRNLRSRFVSIFPTLLSPRFATYKTSLMTKIDTAVEPSLRVGLLIMEK